MLTPVEKLTALTPLSQDLKEARAKEASAPEESPFGAIFRSAIDNVKETDEELKESQYLLATGQLDNPAATMIAAYKNQTAVNMLVQLRNKALDAYSELSRINL
ncbi:MAG: flagellar hook-basal body complex protein FliE [Oscillibacter sp.]|jgi:flagellar hook-basal body complex protein FliE|nr:flagellar hook-basal body complex protein FliE [Oscillibacter sp.]